MPAEKTPAIIVRLVEFSETSLVVTAFTREFGKITGIAKGARRKKSPFEAALDLLAVCRIVFLRKSSGAMDLLTEAKLERRFRAAATDLNRLYAGYYVAELLSKLTDDADPHVELFDLAERTIVALDQGTESVFGVLLRFECRALTLLGHRMMLNRCVLCGKIRQPSKAAVFFGLVEGGLLCSTCRPGKTNVVKAANSSIKLLDNMAEPDFEWTQSDLDSINRGEVRQLTNRYMTHLLGKPPRLLNYLKKLD